MSVNFDYRINSIEESTIQPLVPAASSANATPSHPTHSKTPFRCPLSKCFKNHHICSRSKGAILILLWNIIVGSIYGAMQCAAVALAVNFSADHLTDYSAYTLLYVFGGMALGQMLLYPVGGLLADIWYGRFKIIIFSVVKITLGAVVMSIAAILNLKNSGAAPENLWLVVYYFCVGMSVILLLLGFSGFQSNAVQFGLDQFLEAPTEDLSVFLHWYVWTSNLGEMIARLLGSFMVCNKELRRLVRIVPLLYAVPSCAMLFLSCYKHQWFHCEPRTQNPYGLVYKVLRFVAKHKQPLQRSALTFSDDVMPSRMDFAKTKFGGPFTTEVVEDVKTFLRILVMLFFISPTFYYRISSSNLFPLYALHMGASIPLNNKCTTDWLVFQSGNLAYVVSFVAIPFYVFFLLPRVQKWAPRMLHRLWAGILITFLCVCVMSVLYSAALYGADRNNINSTCLFLADYHNNTHFSQTLEFPVLPLIIPNILAGLALPIINITFFEFISAQSPHTMKGLLLGMFYTIRGMFILVGCLMVFPFSASVLENTGISPFLDCGFFYYLFNAILGLLCLALAMGGNWWYRYREREEKPYSHTYVEDYYANRGNPMISSTEMPLGSQIDCSILNYGTMDET